MLCNAAHLDTTGLVSVLGGWVDSVAGPQLPVRSQLWIAARLTIEPSDVTTPHTLQIVVEHASGDEQVARVDAGLPPGTPESIEGIDPEMPIGIPVVVPLPLEFRRTGRYLVRLIVDGERLWESPIKVLTTFPQV